MDLNGYCAVKDEHYYGFEGYLTINLEGGISERRRTRVLPETTQGISGLLIGDKGYIRPLLRQDLFEQWIDLQTPLRKNMDDNSPESFVQQLMSARRLVETVIGQLTERFNIRGCK